MISRSLFLSVTATVLFASCSSRQATAQDGSKNWLPQAKPLMLTEPLDVVMVRGINRFAERELEQARVRRAATRQQTAFDADSHRAKFRKMVGVVDARVKTTASPFLTPYDADRGDGVTCSAVQWNVMDGVTGEGLLLRPNGPIRAAVVAIPDANQTPEQFCGISETGLNERSVPIRLASAGCLVIVPTLIDRTDTWSGHPDIRYTNLSHREFIYRMAFEMGRHVIGYELQRILAVIDAFDATRAAQRDSPMPIAVCGSGDGGLLSLYAAAIDPRIDVCMVSGYLDDRTNVWQEPIDRNVWRLLVEFGDADLCRLVLPRKLIIETAKAIAVDGPLPSRDGRPAYAAPGRISSTVSGESQTEIDDVLRLFHEAGAGDNVVACLNSAPGDDSFCGDAAFAALADFLNLTDEPIGGQAFVSGPLANAEIRQRRQFDQLVRFTQALLHRSDKVRAKLWKNADRSSIEAWESSSQFYRDLVHDEMIGRLPLPTAVLNPRARKVIDEPTHVGYEVVLDVYPDGTDEFDCVFAGGILLLPKDLKKGERRPVVVCQHGLEGIPMDTITTDKSVRAWSAYKGFSAQLVKQGYIVYAPQNPYRGYHEFRVIQRKSNPLGRSLFSYIIEQHRQTLKWLALLPHVDADRIAFYGLSYGGKTAVRVPPLLPPTDDQPGYCLSICSADFNEWIRKNVSSEDRYSYIFTQEYEMFEWNMGHVAGYAELVSLMTPRPFMVERGHNDGVAPDEWVAWEYAKVRRHYVQLGIGDRTEIEWFNGPHTINGKGTFAFLQKHLGGAEH
jgi:dienelactone hydrolase